jgi:pimeloyl-ACP methyl ester carboxylesterase
MSADWLARVRSTRRWSAPGGAWSYDTWGRHGRPVVLLHPVLFDRTMWWPIAADLRTEGTMIAVDLPGHGTSPSRDRYDPEALVEDLAHLLHGLGMTRAPVVVGHGSSAGLAALFAARFATHAVVTVDPVTELGFDAPVGVDHVWRYLAAMPADPLPPHYRGLVTAAPDPALLAGYVGCIAGRLTSAGARPGAASIPLTCECLEIYSQQPTGKTPAVAAAAGPWRSVVYEVPGRFAHLADVPRFVSDLRSVL